MDEILNDIQLNIYPNPSIGSIILDTEQILEEVIGK